MTLQTNRVGALKVHFLSFSSTNEWAKAPLTLAIRYC